MGSPLICNAAALWLKASYFLFLSLLYISGRAVDTRNVRVYVCVCVCVCVWVCMCVRYYILGVPIWSDTTSWSADLVSFSSLFYLFINFFFYKKPNFSRKNVEKLAAPLTEMSASWGKNNLFHTQKEEKGKHSKQKPVMANWKLKNKNHKINK